METVKKEETKKKEGGCMYFIVRAAIGIAIIMAVDYATTWIFHSAYPHDEITTALKPFQNYYLATTDAFITSEGFSLEFTDDPGPTSRFLGRCIIPFVAVFLLFVVISIIPFLEKLSPFMIPTLIVAMVLLMIDSLFLPPVLTEFDRERRVMIIHKPEWMVVDNKTEIPFSDITGFTHEIEKINGDQHVDDFVNVDLYATTATGKIFIGENQLIRYTHDDSDDPDVIPVFRHQRMEIAQAIDALQKLIK